MQQKVISVLTVEQECVGCVMSKYIDANALAYKVVINSDANFINKVTKLMIDTPNIDIVFCKECKHRPIKEDPNGKDYGFNIIKPNGVERCPCLVEDGWYSWMPKDNFYCGFGERESE